VAKQERNTIIQKLLKPKIYQRKRYILASFTLINVLMST